MMQVLVDSLVTDTKLSIFAVSHRQSGAPLLAVPKESGSGDGTGGPRPEGAPKIERGEYQ